MTDKAVFAAFVSSGAFSGGHAPSMPAQRAVLLEGFKTYIVSKALAANEFKATSWTTSPRNDPDGWAKAHCSPAASEATSGCWFDEQRQLVFKLVDRVGAGTDLLEKLVAKGWTHAQGLLGNVAACNGGHKGQAGQYVSIGVGGLFDTSCLNQLELA